MHILEGYAFNWDPSLDPISRLSFFSQGTGKSPSYFCPHLSYFGRYPRSSLLLFFE
jgi:hypothetical protein